MTDGGLAISSQVVVGTNGAYSGDIRTGETYASDQSSQIEVTSTQLSGGQWIGAAVRAQNGGQNLYLGLYFWNNGNPELMLFKRISGNWTQLGASSFQGALAAGTQLTLAVSGSTLTFSQNGVVRITATDTSLTGGAPGMMAFGTPQGDNWVGVGTNSGAPTYSVGGTISGLSGTVVLENNGGNDLSTSANGAFTFSTPLAEGAAYNVTVKTNPTGQTCTVTNPSGTMATANVTNVSVTCVTQVVPTYTVGGTISGLTGTVVLENNGGNDLSTSANGAFAFSTPLAQGAAYNVTVKTNPTGQTCTVTNPSGTVAHGRRHQRLGHLRDPDGRRLRLGQLQPGQRNPRRRLDRHDRRRAGHLVPGGGGHQRHLLGRHPHRRDLRQRPVLPDRGHLHPAQRWAVDRCGGASPKRRPEPLSRSLLLEQRQSRVDAVQADQWQLDPARRVLVPGCPGGGHPVEPHRLRLDAHVLPKRCRAHHGHRHQPDRGRAGRHGLRRPTR